MRLSVLAARRPICMVSKPCASIPSLSPRPARNRLSLLTTRGSGANLQRLWVQSRRRGEFFSGTQSSTFESKFKAEEE